MAERSNLAADAVRRGPGSLRGQPARPSPARILRRQRPLPAERHPSANPGYLRGRARLRVLEPHRAAAYLPPRIAIRRRRMIPGLRYLHRNQGSTRRLASIRGLAPPARRRPAVFVRWEPPPGPAGGGGGGLARGPA